MLCHKTIGKNANFALKRSSLFISRKGNVAGNTCCALIHSCDQKLAQNYFNFEGHISCNYEQKSFLKVKLNVGSCVNRGIATSGVYLSVHVDTKKNYYHILGVTPHCSNAKIKQSYYRLSKVFHPDINKTQAAVLRFHDIKEAYEVLLNPELRHDYDNSQLGKHHGVHRTFRDDKMHTVNFSAKGPHQKRHNRKKHFDDHLRTSYSKAIGRMQFDMQKRDALEDLHDPLSRNKATTSDQMTEDKNASLSYRFHKHDRNKKETDHSHSQIFQNPATKTSGYSYITPVIVVLIVGMLAYYSKK